MQRLYYATVVGLVATLLSGGCATLPSEPRALLVELPATKPASASVGPTAAGPAASDDDAKARLSFQIVSEALGREGVYKTPGVYVVTVPRDDLMLAIDGMAVPPAAGIESVFHFYYCPCGKTNVVGQFCVLDYEVNDVIDALREAKIQIVSVAPMLLHTRNAPIAVRFFAESKPEPLAKAIREALRWTGKERMAPVEPLLPGQK